MDCRRAEQAPGQQGSEPGERYVLAEKQPHRGRSKTKDGGESRRQSVRQSWGDQIPPAKIPVAKRTAIARAGNFMRDAESRTKTSIWYVCGNISTR